MIILDDHDIWRINGKKEQPNPMNLQSGLPKKADCQIYVSDEDRDEIRSGYEQLADELNERGWNVLGMGILEIDLENPE